MTNIKSYEEADFVFEFVPQGSPYEGTLVARYPELDPFIDRINLAKDDSRTAYAKRAQEESGVSREILKSALNALASKRHEEVVGAAQAGAETDAESGHWGAGGGPRGLANDLELLVSYAEDVELFRTPGGEPHATFDVDDHRENWSVEGRRFELYLRQRYYEDRGTAPKAQTVNDAVATIAAKAMFGGTEARVYVRIAGHGGAVYVDLCNEAWEAVEIARGGWGVVSDPPVKFVRKNNAAPLPHPVSGGNVEELKRFLNLDEQYFKLVVGWLVGAFNPEGPYPVLEINGWQGTAKSTASRVLVAITDPAVAPLRALPSNERDLAIAAGGRWTLAYDNVSYIRSEISDALCRLATGGGFGTRRLYTDDEEMVFDAKRPQIVNGINPVVLRGDLQERSLQIVLNAIPPEERRQEREFWREFEEALPRIFGALLDAVGCSLRNLDEVRLEESPRMADFAAWVTAAEEALGWEPGTFVGAYMGNRKEASEALLENDPVAAAVDKLLTLNQGEWSGTADSLLASLNHQVTDEVKRSKSWPKAPNQLSRHLNRIAPALKEAGIEYLQREEGRERRRVKTLRKIRPTPPVDLRHGAAEGSGEASGPYSHGTEGEGESAGDDRVDGFDEVDYLGELAKLGWHRDERALSGLLGGAINIDEDPVARVLRHEVPIYHGPRSHSWHVPLTAPQVFSAEEVLDWGDRDTTEEVLRSAGWPTTPEGMAARLARVIPALQERPYPFYDPSVALWYFEERRAEPTDPEKLCREALLHAEIWRNDSTSETLWVLVALQPGWPPPREEIERFVWLRVTDEGNPGETPDGDGHDFEF